MAILKETSTCSNGIQCNNTVSYTLITLPSGGFLDDGFTDDGSFYFDTARNQFCVILSGTRYKISEVNFTAL
jgi:hypothetical protein